MVVREEGMKVRDAGRKEGGRGGGAGGGRGFVYPGPMVSKRHSGSPARPGSYKLPSVCE